MNFKITFASQDETFPLELGEVTARIVPADPDLQDKTVTPTESTQTVTCDAPHDGLGTVTVNPIPAEYVIPSGTVVLSSNGQHDVSGKAVADVSVTPSLQRKSVTPTRAAQTVEPDSGKDGLSAVDVGGIPSEYVIPTGTVTLSSNGPHDVSGKAVADVNVQPVLQSKSVTPTRAAQTVTPDSGKDGLSAVEVGGIPSEYIIPEGSKSITENGTHDVTDYASAVVNVPGPSGQIEITENGMVDVAAFASALVNVAGGGGASNVVLGEFQFAGSSIDTPYGVEVPYSGNGYPVAIAIFPADMNAAMNTRTANVVLTYVAIKQKSSAPTYAGSGSENNAFTVDGYKSGTGATAASFKAGVNITNYIYSPNDPDSSFVSTVRISDKNHFKVTVRGYTAGFIKNMLYKYIIVYSE